ncbi:MAG: hypothetical protein K2X86_17285 [Cytophagaceae bacterium]|nr:hypothetical protein [Cytophagaceae bacterium]
MTKIEFLQMVPALLFGISLAEVAIFLGRASRGRWKIYWEHLLLIIFSFEMIIFNWYIFYDRINSIEASYLNFLIQLCAPLASFVYVANLLVKNTEGEEPEIFFLKNRKRIFLSLAVFASINVLTVVYFNTNLHVGSLPIIPISIILINAFYDLKWFRIMAYIIKCIQVVMVCIYLK